MLAQPNFGRLGAVGYRSLAAAVRALFANNEQGAWYDPQDYGTSGTDGVGTLYQDFAGQTPVTAVEQPVGLMLDKRRSKYSTIGSELVTNGSFATDTDWTKAAGVTISGGVANFSAVSSSSALYQNLTGIAVGNSYVVTYTVTISAGSMQTQINGNTAAPSRSVSGTYTDILHVPAATNKNFIFVVNAFTGTIDNVSVKRLDGNHAYQSTSAARPTLRARYTLLTYSEQFDNAAWNKVNSSISQNAGTAPDGTLTADKLIDTAANTVHSVYQSVTVLASTRYTLSFYAKAAGRNWVTLDPVYPAVANNITYFDLQNGVVGTNDPDNTASITSVGGGWYRCAVSHTTAVGQTSMYMQIAPASADGGITYIGNGTDGVLVWGADLRPSNLATGLIPLYQRIAAATDYDTVGFPVYIQGNGSSQFMQTAAIDFSSTDKMTVWSAVRKLSDAAQGMVCELTASYAANGASIFLSAPGGAAANYTSGSRGAAVAAADQVSTATTYTAPISGVLSSSHDIAGDLTTLRVNSTAAANATGDKGAGNFANAALYLLSRGGASLWFGGYFYGAIIRGAASNDGQIAIGERWLNARAKAY